MGKLDRKVAVITGGSDGMGLATAKLFVREGAEVVITGRDEGALQAAVRKIGSGAEGFRSDNAKMADIEALRAHVAQKYGRVDILFANAGGGKQGTIADLSEADFDFTTDVNYKGTFFTVQKLVRLMSSGSSIVLNTSIQSEKGTPGFIAYCATKAAVRSLARTLTAELAPKGIRVNALAPGFIDTDIMRKSGLSEEMIGRMRNRAITQIPLGRIGTVEDIAKSVLYLASDDSSYVTGIELSVDGGSNQV
jgi:NAD(P)-dependent dehydrogenase (short-subunit alcohol dehydrogenase family)